MKAAIYKADIDSIRLKGEFINFEGSRKELNRQLKCFQADYTDTNESTAIWELKENGTTYIICESPGFVCHVAKIIQDEQTDEEREAGLELAAECSEETGK